MQVGKCHWEQLQQSPSIPVAQRSSDRGPTWHSVGQQSAGDPWHVIQLHRGPHQEGAEGGSPRIPASKKHRCPWGPQDLRSFTRSREHAELTSRRRGRGGGWSLGIQHGFSITVRGLATGQGTGRKGGPRDEGRCHSPKPSQGVPCAPKVPVKDKAPGWGRYGCDAPGSVPQGTGKQKASSSGFPESPGCWPSRAKAAPGGSDFLQTKSKRGCWSCPALTHGAASVSTSGVWSLDQMPQCSHEYLPSESTVGDRGLGATA